MLILLVGPRWRVRDRLEEVHDEIVHNWPAVHVFRIIRISLPLFASLGVSLTLPYLLAHHLSPYFGESCFLHGYLPEVEMNHSP